MGPPSVLGAAECLPHCPLGPLDIEQADRVHLSKGAVGVPEVRREHGRGHRLPRQASKDEPAWR